MRNNSGTEQLLIGKSIARTATVNVLDSTNASYLADGEIVVLDENDTPLVAGTLYPASRFIKIVQRSASQDGLVQSARIDGKDMISFRGLSYAAPQEQITTIGTIDATGTDDFVLRITMTHDKDMWSQRANTRIYRYVPTTSTIDSDVADYFGQSLGNDDFLRTEVKAERKNSDAGATDGTATTITVANGSKSATLNAGATTFVVGDYLRIGGGAVTDPIYKIVTLSGTAVTLDQKYAGASASGVTIEYITAALATAANWSMTITGKAQTFSVMKFPYLKVKFDLTLSGFGTTPVTRTQESFVGSGVGAQISEIEQFDIGFEGVVDKFGPYAGAGRSDASLTANYDMIVLEYFNSYDTMTVSGAKPARSVLNLAIVDAAAQTASILAQLNPWMASCPGAFANVAV